MEAVTVARIGIDGRELAQGVRTGIGRYLIEVVRAAARAACPCVVYGDGAPPVGLDGTGVTLRTLGAPSTPWWDQVTLPRALRSDGISVFLSPYYKGPLDAPCPVVVTVHDLFFIAYPGTRRPVRDRLMTALARLYARRATAIIADSEHSRRAVVERLGTDPRKVHAIPVALGEEFRPTPLAEPARRRLALTPPFLLYVGNFKPHKNVPGLLAAYARLPETLRARYPLVLAGADRAGRAAVEETARGLDVAGRVVYAGYVAPADLPVLYSAAALLVLPSLEEGFGLPALEAMACGTPVVATDRGAVPEVVGDAGVLVDPCDAGALAAAIGRVLTEPALADTLRARGLVRAGAFAADRTAARVVDLLATVAARGPRAA